MAARIAAAAGFLCIMSVAGPSNADGPIIIRWVAPDGNLVTLQVGVQTPETPETQGTLRREPPPRVQRPSVSSVEDEVLALTNAQRVQGATCGGQYFPPAAALRPNGALRTAAWRHSFDMGERGYFEHTSPDGRSVGDRVHAAGFSGGTWGENIYGGPTTASEAVDGWMKSPGHCRNIMNPRFHFLGVGYASMPSSRLSTYWTQDFGG